MSRPNAGQSGPNGAGATPASGATPGPVATPASVATPGAVSAPGPVAASGSGTKSGKAYSADGTFEGKGNFTKPNSGDFSFFVGSLGSGEDGWELATALTFWAAIVGIALIIMFVAIFVARMPRPVREKASRARTSWLPLSATAFLLGHVLLTWRDGAPVSFIHFLRDRHDLVALFASDDVMTKYWPLRILKFFFFLVVVYSTCVFFLSAYPGAEGEHLTIVDNTELNVILYYCLTISAGSAFSFAIRFGNVSAKSLGSGWILVVWSLLMAALCSGMNFIANMALLQKFNYFGTPVALREDYQLLVLASFGYSVTLNVLVSQPLMLAALFAMGFALLHATEEEFNTHKLMFAGDSWCSFSTLLFARRWMRRCKVGRYRETPPGIPTEHSSEAREAAEDAAHKGVQSNAVAPADEVV